MSIKQFWPKPKVGFAVVSTMLLCGCVPSTGISTSSGAHAQSVATLQRVNSQAHSCWLKDSAFKDFGMIPELDTHSTPRLLIIPRGKPQSLPQGVIVASAKTVQFYGPLASSALAKRMNSDMARWAAGNTQC